MADTIKLSDLTSRFTAVTEDELFETSEYQGVPGDYLSKKITRSIFLGYKDYHVNLSQTGTAAPTKNEFINSFGATTFSFTRLATGNYKCTASTAIFAATKVVLIFGNMIDGSVSTYSNISVDWNTLTTTEFEFMTYNDSDPHVPADGILKETFLEIRVYY